MLLLLQVDSRYGRFVKDLVELPSLGCQAWVYNKATKECFLKSKPYAQLQQVKCADCVASNPSGARYFQCTGRKTQTMGKRVALGGTATRRCVA